MWKSKHMKHLFQMYKYVPEYISPVLWKLDRTYVEKTMYQFSGERHLDIGPGPFPYSNQSPNLKHNVFMDFSKDVLAFVQSHHTPFYDTTKVEYHVGNILTPGTFPPYMFHSISCYNVLHCVHARDKFPTFFRNAHAVLHKEGVVMGSTVTNASTLSRLIFHNRHDTKDQILTAIKNANLFPICVTSLGPSCVFVAKKST